MPTQPIFASLRTAPPDIAGEQAASLLREHFGLTAALHPLASERDLNFRVETGDAGTFVLKFANVTEAPEVTEFQNEALLHLERRHPDLPVPRVVHAVSGNHLVRVAIGHDEHYSMRLLTWLEGVPLQEVDDKAGLAAQTGVRLAELGLALRDFEHPASDYPLPWDIRNASHLDELLPHVANGELRKLCESRLVHFETHTRPVLDGLRKQVIHNDFNPSNMLVARGNSRRLAGIIDFGDMVHSQLVNDVAVAGAYFCEPDDDPFAEVVGLLRAYAARVPLTDDEIDVLPAMILARHLTTVMITHWRAAMYPDNRDYILRNEARAREMLRQVAALPLDQVRQRFHAACRATPAVEAQP